jgi:hypothetical protein
MTNKLKIVIKMNPSTSFISSSFSFFGPLAPPVADALPLISANSPDSESQVPVAQRVEQAYDRVIQSPVALPPSAAIAAAPQPPAHNPRREDPQAYDRVIQSPVALPPSAAIASAPQLPPHAPAAAPPHEYDHASERHKPNAPTRSIPHFVPRLEIPRVHLTKTADACDPSQIAPSASPPSLLPAFFVRSHSTTPSTDFDVIAHLDPSSSLSVQQFRAQLHRLTFKNIRHHLTSNPDFVDYFLQDDSFCLRKGTSCELYRLSSAIKNKPPIVLKLITNPCQLSTTAVYEKDIGEHLAMGLDGFSAYRVVVPEAIYYSARLSGSNEIFFTREPGLGYQLAFTQMSAYSGNTLADWVELHKMSPNLNELAILKNAYQIALALKFLDENGLSHTDIHAKNILVENGVWLLCDFGLLQRRRPDGSLPYNCCNTLISPPERVNGSTSGLNLDAWSFGLLLYFALHQGRHLYEDVEAIRNATADFPISDAISEKSQNLLRGALHPDPAQRFTIQQIVDGLKNTPGLIPSDDDDNKD